MKKNKKKLLLLIIEFLIMIIYLISLGIVGYNIFKLNIIPNKYLIGGSLVLFVISGVFLYFLFAKKKKVLKVISAIFLVLFSCGFVFGTKYLANTYSFLKNTKVDYDILTYSVVVLKESSYDELADLQNKDILYMEDDYKTDIIKELESKIKYEELTFETFGGMAEALLNKEVDALVIEDGYAYLVKEEIKDFDEKTKIIYNFNVKIKAHEEEPKNVDNKNITLNTFILYISGVDQYGIVNSVRGRSDVNQIAIVNPKTHHILFVNTPRDYYVQLDGTKGLKDKLTHAGVYGIHKSIKTLENFYEIDINYYLRVNFDSLIKIVDVIGGIDVESDKAFKSNYIKWWYVDKGINHMDGQKALAFSRERFAYVDGDHHRGRNQQQVMTAIINKVTNSKVLISKYNSILKALEGSFQTDMPMEEMTSFIKYQLDKMPSWKIESIAVTGTGDMQPTYSMGSKLKLYVMNPNMDSVNKAKQKINEVLNEG